MRGEIGQNPMIIDVAYSTSNDSGSNYYGDSDDSSEPETPPASDSDNPDRRYVWKPKPDIPIPQAYNTTKQAKSSLREQTAGGQNSNRGRNAMPKLDTGMYRSKSTGGPRPQLERARSPYASGPQDRNSKAQRFSGEYLLSPDVMNPRGHYADSPRSQSQYFSRPKESPISNMPVLGEDRPRQPVRPQCQRSHSHYVPGPKGKEESGRDNQPTHMPRVPVRPTMDRRSSALPYPSNPPPPTKKATQDWNSLTESSRPSMGRRVTEMPYPVSLPPAHDAQPQSKRPSGPHNDSDSDRNSAGGKSDRDIRQRPPVLKATKVKDRRHHDRQSSSELPASRHRRSVPSSGTDGPPVNFSSLLSGAAIHQTLAAMLNGDHTAGRKASPRPSPGPSPGVSPSVSARGSAKSSPYSSPPRTPPSERSHHRVYPVTGLKKDSPSSRPTSPLSSRSSTWTMEQDQNVCESDQTKRSRPVPLRSRQTAPLPAPKVEEPEHLEPPTPGIYVRSPSPAKHAKSFSAEAGEPQSSRPGMGLRPDLSEEASHVTELRPTGFSGRPRSASSTDVRPQLTVNPAPFVRESESPLSPHTRSRDRSPGFMSPADRYKPQTLEPASPAVRSRSSHPEAASSRPRPRSKSRSYVPESPQAVPLTHATPVRPAALQRSRSSMPFSGSAEIKQQASTAKPTVLPSAPMQPESLPLCPRPHSVAGYDDWHTLSSNTAFTICPSCRDNVFGPTQAHHLEPRSVSSSKKILCDLNNPWIRLACLTRGPDISALSALSDVTSKERACPGDELAPRDWYRLEDPDSGKHISGVNACPHCVHSLKILFPHWRDVFYRARTSQHHELKERFCSLRSSATRFGDYLDMVVVSSHEAEKKRKSPNTKPFCDLAKQLAAIDDCPRDKMNPRKAWHIHPHLPEFTICQDCYEAVVYPLVKTGSPLAAKIDKKPQQFPNPDVKCCCNLYSPRMRKVFREACEDEDYEHLRHTVLKRHMLQQDLLETLGEKDAHPRDEEVTERLQDLVARWKEKE